MHISPANLLARIMKLENGLFNNNGETWHTASLSGSGWNASGSGVNGLIYRMNRDGDLQLAWDISSTSSPVTVLPAGTLPVGYYNPSQAYGIQTTWGGSGPTSYNAAFAPSFALGTTGGISAVGIFITGLRCFGVATVPISS